MKTILQAKYPFTEIDILKWENEKCNEWDFLEEDNKRELLYLKTEQALGFLAMCKRFFLDSDNPQKKWAFYEGVDFPFVKEFLSGIIMLGHTPLNQGLKNILKCIEQHEEMNCQPLVDYIDKEIENMYYSYWVLWLEALFKGVAVQSNPVPFFIMLIKHDSPGTYEALQRGLRSGMVTFSQDGKIDFKCISKGSLAHIFKTGGYTEWGRVSDYVTLDGQEITGTLKTLAGNEPPKDFEQIKKELYPN